MKANSDYVTNEVLFVNILFFGGSTLGMTVIIVFPLICRPVSRVEALKGAGISISRPGFSVKSLSRVIQSYSLSLGFDCYFVKARKPTERGHSCPHCNES